MNKKAYINPELETIEVKAISLLAGSTDAPVSDEEQQDNGQALSPGMEDWFSF